MRNRQREAKEGFKACKRGGQICIPEKAIRSKLQDGLEGKVEKVMVMIQGRNDKGWNKSSRNTLGNLIRIMIL